MLSAETEMQQIKRLHDVCIYIHIYTHIYIYLYTGNTVIYILIYFHDCPHIVSSKDWVDPKQRLLGYSVCYLGNWCHRKEVQQETFEPICDGQECSEHPADAGFWQ